ncbi:MAG TPA: enolase C-terminal domain-like protein [Mycobacteriales bacterium]
MPRVQSVQVLDLRFPTSATLDGSDAMNPDGDYSAAYVLVRTDRAGLVGHGLTFTLGRGTDLCVRAAEQLGRQLVGRDVDRLCAGGMAELYRDITADSQYRWLGPEKGVVQLAAAAVLNAGWDLVAKHAGTPLWRFLCDLTPAELADLCDFRYLSDVLTRAEAEDMLAAMAPTREQRVQELRERGYPAYTTSPGWLGYDDGKLGRLVREAVRDGWTHVKLKVGGDLGDDRRRLAIAREELGPDRELMIDANQVWDVDQAVRWVTELAPFRPLWIEEPTSPDDVAGHAAIRRAVAPVGVATGEHAHNRVMFKQFLQSGAIDYCQIDSCRVASIHEILPVLLMAAKFGVPVCPHAGGVGLCEYVQHLSILDYVCVSGALDGRMTEYVDHLHEHFVDPVRIRAGRYLVPTAPGYSIEILPASLERYRYPDGAAWAGAPGPR